jgi:GNAT superfamily N-acetyltransferase
MRNRFPILKSTEWRDMAAKSPVALNLDGYTDLPQGKIATVVTYLEMRERPRLSRMARPPGWSLERMTDDLDRYRAIFQHVGEPWLWFSRAVMPDETLAAVVFDPKVEVHILSHGSADIGLLELDFRERGEAELTFLGLVPGALGRGAGRFLMNEAIRRVFAKPVNHFFVHTCTLDHPAALAFYMRSGFTAYKRAIEVADDPRLLGFLPLEAAPHVPVIGRPQTKRTRPVAARPRRRQTKEA